MREVTVAYKRIGAPTAGCREALRRSTLLVTSDLGYQELITRKRRIDSGFPSFSYFFAFPPPPLGIGSVDLCHLLSRFKERNTKEEKRSLPSRKRSHRLLRELSSRHRHSVSLSPYSTVVCNKQHIVDITCVINNTLWTSLTSTSANGKNPKCGCGCYLIESDPNATELRIRNLHG